MAARPLQAPTSHQPPSSPPGIITTALLSSCSCCSRSRAAEQRQLHCRLGIHVHTLFPTLAIFHVPKRSVTRQETGRLEIVHHQPWRGLCRSCSPSPRRDPTGRPQRLSARRWTRVVSKCTTKTLPFETCTLASSSSSTTAASPTSFHPFIPRPPAPTHPRLDRALITGKLQQLLRRLIALASPVQSRSSPEPGPPCPPAPQQPAELMTAPGADRHRSD